MAIWAILFMVSNSWAANPAPVRAPTNCGCVPGSAANPCGVQPAFMSRDDASVSRDLGFDVPRDNVGLAKKITGHDLYRMFAKFLENSDHARALNPEYY